VLSVIAGMVDLIGFLSLGIFTAHITGYIVVIEHQEDVVPAYCGYFSWFSFCCSLAC
jgi:hypothetical protein